MSNERDMALMEANCIAGEDEYFAARPQIDSMDRRRVYEAGFKRAWKAAMEGRNCDGSLIPAKPFVHA